MERTKIIVIMTMFWWLVEINAHGQSQSYTTPRAISINDVEFEVKGNVLGIFYNSPVVDYYGIEGDSIRIKGIVYYQRIPQQGVHFYVCQKKRPKLRECIGRQRLYVLDRYLTQTTQDGCFEIVIHKRNEYLLYRDYNRNQDGFLFFN